jgi:hypothetical protein
MADQASETVTMLDPTDTVLGDVRSLEQQSNEANPKFVKHEANEASLVASTDVTDPYTALDKAVPSGPLPSVIDIDLENDEEEKPKPMLQLKYQGFGIYGHCLCIVVEPWPPMRSVSRAASVMPTASSSPLIGLVSTGEGGARLGPPLLPDNFGRETRTPFLSQKALPPVPLSNDPNPAEVLDEDDYDGSGMMELSQVLNAAGEFRAGAANDDEEMESGAFFGDADEAREM